MACSQTKPNGHKIRSHTFSHTLRPCEDIGTLYCHSNARPHKEEVYTHTHRRTHTRSPTNRGLKSVWLRHKKNTRISDANI